VTRIAQGLPVGSEIEFHRRHDLVAKALESAGWILAAPVPSKGPEA
jgi:hypothetical protein